MRISKLAILSFVISALLFFGAGYKFLTTGVTVAPFMLIGVASCLLCTGIVLASYKKNEKPKDKK